MSLFAPTMEQRLSLVTLAPRDLAAAAAFYERIGWTSGFRNDEVAFFQLNGIVLSLWQRDQMARETGLAAATLGPGGTQLAHNVRAREEVDAAVARWRGAGGRVLREAHDTDWGGRSAHVADPEGFPWEIAWNPAWTIAPDGAVRMA